MIQSHSTGKLDQRNGNPISRDREKLKKTIKETIKSDINFKTNLSKDIVYNKLK